MRIDGISSNIVELLAGRAFSAAPAFAPDAGETAAVPAIPADAGAYLSARADYPVELQAETPPERPGREAFLAYMQKSPAERMRDQILQSMGLTEDSLAAMTPEERMAVEDKISKIIQEKFREALREQGYAVDAADIGQRAQITA